LIELERKRVLKLRQIIIIFCGSKILLVGRRDQNLDQGSKFSSKIKVLGIASK
jgi:hypothetical protein